MQSNEFKQVYVDELKDIYSAESQLVKALPKVAKALVSPQLVQAIESHLEETKAQAVRLKSLLESMGEDTKGPAYEAMKGILEEGSKMIEEIQKGPVRDAALIAGCQKVEHYEIASYGSVVEWAKVLGLNDHAKVLQTTLDEEGNADKTLSTISQTVNRQALNGEDDAEVQRHSANCPKRILEGNRRQRQALSVSAH